MELNELKIFKTVAEEGSVTRAAVRLNYVQSNVTARIRQLEETLNVSLFHRKSRGVALTPVGHVFLEYAKRILLLADEAVQVVQERNEPIGTLTIGSIETTAVAHLPPILSAYHSQYPLVDLQLLTGNSEQMLTSLLDYRVDGAFVGGPVDHPDLIGEVILQEEIVLATAKSKFPFGKKARQNILVFPKGCAFRARLETWLRDSGSIPYRIMEFSSVESILGCVLAGMGITFLPHSVFSLGKYDGKIDLYPLPKDIAFLPVNFIKRRDRTGSKALEAFHGEVRRWTGQNSGLSYRSLQKVIGKSRLKRAPRSSASLKPQKSSAK